LRSSVEACSSPEALSLADEEGPDGQARRTRHAPRQIAANAARVLMADTSPLSFAIIPSPG
jgi:hypothetical protein